MSLEDYLGDMKWYLDILLGRSDGGMEVRGVPQLEYTLIFLL
jgi:hypothetical protein